MTLVNGQVEEQNKAQTEDSEFNQNELQHMKTELQKDTKRLEELMGKIREITNYIQANDAELGRGGFKHLEDQLYEHQEEIQLIEKKWDRLQKQLKSDKRAKAGAEMRRNSQHNKKDL